MGSNILDEPIIVSELEWMSNSFKILTLFCVINMSGLKIVSFVNINNLGHITRIRCTLNIIKEILLM